MIRIKMTGAPPRFRLCPDCGEAHEASDWPDNHRHWEEVVCSPSVVRDGLDDLFHPMTNARIDSKREFSRITKEQGGIEVGNEEQKDTRKMDAITPDEVAQAKAKVDQGYVPHPEQATAQETRDVIA